MARSAAAATRSTPMRVMQRKSPGAHTRWRQGRHGNAPASMASACHRGSRHGIACSGSVAPNTPTTGVVVAPVMCKGPVSPPMYTAARPDECGDLGEREHSAHDTPRRRCADPAARVLGETSRALRRRRARPARRRGALGRCRPAARPAPRRRWRATAGTGCRRRGGSRSACGPPSRRRRPGRRRRAPPRLGARRSSTASRCGIRIGHAERRQQTPIGCGRHAGVSVRSIGAPPRCTSRPGRGSRSRRAGGRGSPT